MVRVIVLLILWVQLYKHILNPVEMRATPSVSFDDNNGNSNRFAVNGSNNSTTFNVSLSLQQNIQGIMGAFQYPHGISGISENESFRLWNLQIQCVSRTLGDYDVQNY